MGTTNYLYDGANLLEETDGAGNVLARYTQDVGIDQLLSQLRSGTTSYYEQNALGSVTSLSNGAGALANTYSYDSFGKLSASTGTITNPFQYSGRESDPESGLYYYRARYYDPSAGRFLSEDPLGFRAGANFYLYVGNAPTNMIDPSGKSAGAAPALGQAPGYCAANPLVCLGVIDLGLLAYDSYEAYQLGVAYGWWGQPKPKQCSDDCGKLLASLLAQMQTVQSRYAALMTDPLNLYNLAYSTPSASMPDAGTWLGHVDALADAQRGLQNRIYAAKAKGCPIPPQAEFLAELPLPTKPGWRK